MKRFSDELTEDREFEIGGEIFRWRYPHWEETAALFDEDVQMLREMESEDGDGSMPTTRESVERTIERTLLFLEQDQHERFRALAGRKDPPVPLFQFSGVYRWLLEVTSGRPTTQPSDSEAGDGGTEATSRAGSRSRAATRTG